MAVPPTPNFDSKACPSTELHLSSLCHRLSDILALFCLTRTHLSPPTPHNFTAHLHSSNPVPTYTSSCAYPLPTPSQPSHLLITRSLSCLSFLHRPPYIYSGYRDNIIQQSRNIIDQATVGLLSLSLYIYIYLMNVLTPHSMHSPISPYDQQSKLACSVQQRPYYPATPQPDPPSMEQSNNGLGIFDCPLPPPQATVQQLPPSPQPSDSWSHSSMMEQDYQQTSQQPPDIFSAAFDPFSGFSNSANTAMLAAPSPEAPGLVFCQTPPSTNLPSHRSSISSSYSDTESYSQHGSDYYTPKVKMEDGNEWYPSPGNEQVLQRSLITQGLSPYSTGVSPINGSNDDWSKTGPGAYRVEFNAMAGEEPRSRYDAAPMLPSVTRIKKKRQRTTPEEATHECRVCGKLFKRSYNWKSHMETHNPERKYPHPCTAMVGSQPCTKRFQRKTDLDRHNDSVHLKARNHRCGLCGNRFARRDTLRRYVLSIVPVRHHSLTHSLTSSQTHRRRLPQAVRSGIPRRLRCRTGAMVFAHLHGPLDGSTDVSTSSPAAIPKLQPARIRQQSYPDRFGIRVMTRIAEGGGGGEGAVVGFTFEGFAHG